MAVNNPTFAKNVAFPAPSAASLISSNTIPVGSTPNLAICASINSFLNSLLLCKASIPASPVVANPATTILPAGLSVL